MLHKKEEKSPYRLDPPKKMHRAKQAVLSQNQTSQVKTLSFSYHYTANLMQRNLSSRLVEHEGDENLCESYKYTIKLLPMFT